MLAHKSYLTKIDGFNLILLSPFDTKTVAYINNKVPIAFLLVCHSDVVKIVELACIHDIVIIPYGGKCNGTGYISRFSSWLFVMCMPFLCLLPDLTSTDKSLLSWVAYLDFPMTHCQLWTTVNPQTYAENSFASLNILGDVWYSSDKNRLICKQLLVQMLSII